MLAASAVREVGELFDDVEARRVAGGNQLVAERLAAGLRVELGTPAVRVAQVGDGLRVNDDLDVDAVVVAVPAPATDGIAFDPPLPAWKADALARVVYGQAAKLAVPLLAQAQTSSVLSVPRALLDVDGEGRRRSGGAAGYGVCGVAAGCGRAAGG